MRQARQLLFVLVLAMSVAYLAGVGGAASEEATGTVVFDSIPTPTPPNVVSLGFQATATQEIGDEITLDPDTPRRAGYATVLMSNWAKHSDYDGSPTSELMLPAAGFQHSITLNVYSDAAAAAARTPVATRTQTFLIPWRPEADPTCAGGTAWRAGDGNCYNGFAFKIVFDLRSLGLELQERFVYGVAYNTNTWGYEPIGAHGPYESLNVGLNAAPPIPTGIDVDPDVVFWNTQHAPFYADDGAAGVGIFRPDADWAPYTPAVQFTTFAVPGTIDSCKNGAWKNLVRTDFSAFKNQGDCIAYVNTGR